MENQKCTRTKRFVLFTVLTVLTVLIGWHIYAHFLYKDALRQQQLNKLKQEIYAFTSQLYELEKNFSFVQVNFQDKITTNSSHDGAPQL